MMVSSPTLGTSLVFAVEKTIAPLYHHSHFFGTVRPFSPLPATVAACRYCTPTTNLVFQADHIGFHLHEVLHAVDKFGVVPVAHAGDLAALFRLEFLQGDLRFQDERRVGRERNFEATRG